MSTNVPIPKLPLPPATYSQSYMSQLVRAYARAITLLKAPGQGRNTTIVLTNLQTDDVDLEAGALYRDVNTLKISVLHVAALRGAATTGSVGLVSVIT